MHFKNHSKVSSDIYKEISNNETVTNLISRDMDIHLLKAKDVPFFCRDKKDAITLLIIGLCEVNSNAALFGGIESTSFKIKFKQIQKRGKSIIDALI